MRKVYIIGIIGAVACGKSTLAQSLADGLRRHASVIPAQAGIRPNQSIVAMDPATRKLAQYDGRVPCAQYLVLPPITTDNFLYPNEVMEEMGLLGEKGAPQTHNETLLREFIENLRNSSISLGDILLPKYSHTQYNIIGQQNLLDSTDYDTNAAIHAETIVLILEGVGVGIVRDLLDAYIYYDVDIETVHKRYLARTLSAWQAGKLDTESWYHQFRTLDAAEFTNRANEVWQSVNLGNYYDYILPEKSKADYILQEL